MFTKDKLFDYSYTQMIKVVSLRLQVTSRSLVDQSCSFALATVTASVKLVRGLEGQGLVSGESLGNALKGKGSEYVGSKAQNGAKDEDGAKPAMQAKTKNTKSSEYQNFASSDRF